MASGLLGAVIGVLAACSSDEDQTAQLPPPAEAGAPDAVLVDAAVVEPETGDAGPFEVVDEPDTPCDPAVATKAALYPGAPSRNLTELSVIGDRRVALRDDGLVTFAADGTGPSAPVVPAATVASTGTTAIAVGIDNDGLYFTRHDATGKHLSLAARFEPEPSLYRAFSGGGGGGALVAWSGPYGLRARAVNADGNPAAPTFRLGGVGENVDVTGSITSDGPNGFAAVWSGRDGKRHRTAFARTTFADRTSGVNLEIGETPRSVVQLQKRDGGFAVLIEYGADSAAHVVLLDANGKRTGPVRRLVGTRGGLGLAQRAGELGVLALHTGTGDGGVEGKRVAFRPFDQAGKALGAWVCLDDTDTSSELVMGSILGEASGYAAVYRAPSGAIVHARFGALGK